tara:strand:+ start:824 stop:928 length:105 start_codon:yes stop_codon:yes gene_type:complete
MKEEEQEQKGGGFLGLITLVVAIYLIYISITALA